MCAATLCLWHPILDEGRGLSAIALPNYAPDGLPIIALPYLVLMKLSASRTQDLADISRMLGLAKEEELSKIRLIIKKYLPMAEEDLESLIMLGKLETGY